MKQTTMSIGMIALLLSLTMAHAYTPSWIISTTDSDSKGTLQELKSSPITTGKTSAKKEPVIIPPSRDDLYRSTFRAAYKFCHSIEHKYTGCKIAERKNERGWTYFIATRGK